MSYGLPKNLDTPENNAKMERCVLTLEKQGKSKDFSVAVCKKNIVQEKRKQDLIDSGKLDVDVGTLSVRNIIDTKDKNIIKKQWIIIEEVGVQETGNGTNEFDFVSEDLLKEIVDNFNNGLGKNSDGKVRIGFDHEQKGPVGGWISELKFEYPYLKGLAEFTPLGEKAISNHEYVSTSTEIDSLHRDRLNGLKGKNVLTAITLTNIPMASQLPTLVSQLNKSQETQEKKVDTDFLLNNKKMNNENVEETTESTETVGLEETTNKAVVNFEVHNKMVQENNSLKNKVSVYENSLKNMQSQIDTLQTNARLKDEQVRAKELFQMGMQTELKDEVVNELANMKQEDADKKFDFYKKMLANSVQANKFKELGVQGEMMKDEEGSKNEMQLLKKEYADKVKNKEMTAGEAQFELQNKIAKLAIK